MWVHLTTKSNNTKVGKIPVSTTEKSSCPTECPLKDKECYARFGPLGIHWNKVKEGDRGDNWWAFCKRVKSFVHKQLWRHNQAGDLPQTKNGDIDHMKCIGLSNASKHTRGWTYTHYSPFKKRNAQIIKRMNSVPGMTVNLSADNVDEADKFYDLNIGPVCVTLPSNSPIRENRTPQGRHIIICPAQTTDLNCEQCQLCQIRHRKSIVGFLAHGTASKSLSRKLEHETV